MKKYIFIGLQSATLLKIILYICIFQEFWHVANFRKAIFKNTFSRTPGVPSFEMINLTREVSMNFFIYFSSEVDMQKMLEIDLIFKLCNLVSKKPLALGGFHIRWASPVSEMSLEKWDVVTLVKRASPLS